MSIDYLHGLRDLELDAARRDFPPCRRGDQRTRVLDLGAGTGRQAARLDEAGYEVTALDLPSSAYAAARVFPILDYDGRTLPLPDRHMDVVFSSNVLEHVSHLDSLLAETRRVLADGGLAIHVLPTTSWRVWTTFTHFPWVATRALRALLAPGKPGRGERVAGVGPGYLADLWPRRHGERGNVLTEGWYFSAAWWRKAFEEAGFEVVAARPSGIFYTGSVLLGGQLGMGRRKKLARWLGSSCRIYVLRPARQAAARRVQE